MYFTVEPAGRERSRDRSRQRLPLYKTILGIACALLLVVNGWSLFNNLKALKSANFQLTQSALVADRLQYMNVLVLDAESGMRGYFISGLEAYLGPSKTASEQVEKQFRELARLLADSPSQLKNLAQLRTLVWRKISLMNQAIEVYKQGGLDEIVKIAKVSGGRAAMDEIHLQVMIMEQEQEETLTKRAAGFYREYQKAVLFGIGINILAIMVLIMFYRLVRRSFQAQVRVEHALQDANDNLESTVAKRTEQLSVLSRHLIKVSEKEKASLARELHDELGANLTAIGMDIAFVAERVRASVPELAEQLGRARGKLLETVELKRRLVEDLRPSLLDNLGLCAAVRSYCDEFVRMSSVKCETDVELDLDRADPTLTIALFRIVQESLTNILKYAKASKVSVSLTRGEGGLCLRIVDDGVGIADDTLVKPMTHGLLGMRERALLLGGTLTIRRGRNNRGTCVEACIPLPGDGSGAAPAQPLLPGV